MKSQNQIGLTNFDNLPGIDPAVESLIVQVQRRQSDAHLSRTERSHKKKERERAEKRKPNRLNLDLPLELKKNLESLAKKEGVPISQLVAFLLFEPVHQLDKHSISLWGYKSTSGCHKFEWNLDLRRKAEEVAKQNGLTK